MRRAVASMLLAALAAVFPGVPPAGAQEETVGGAFVDTLDVQAVNVEVVVTDRRGQRVTDLKAGDFRLLVDGTPVPVDYFAEVRDGRAVSLPAAPGEGSAAVPPPALAELGAGDAVGTNYLVFIDEFFSPYSLRNEALKAMSRHLGSLGPRDRMAVVAFDGMRLRVVADWSAPSPALEETLRELARKKGYLTAADLKDSPNALHPLKATADVLTMDRGPQPASVDADRRESLLSIKAITNAAGALRLLEPPPGRKVALILTGGWKLDPRAADHSFDRIQETMSWGDSLALMRPLTDAANRLGYTVYPVHLADTPHPGADQRTTQGPAALGIAHAVVEDSVRSQSLVFSADETGGQLLRPGAQHLRRIADDTRSYYWLGFTSSDSDNRRRSVKVEILRDGLEVRSRSSFVPLSRRARTAISIEGALLTGKEIPGAKALEVKAGAPEKSGLLNAEVPLILQIPVEALTLLPQEGKLVAQLEVWIAAIDEMGRRSDLVVTPAVLTVDQAPEPGQRVTWQTSILARRNHQQEVQLAVTDTASGAVLSSRLRLDL